MCDANGDVQLKEVDPQPVSVQEKSKESEKKLRAIVEALGCRHPVIGHQPGRITFADGSVREAGQIFTKFDGLFFMMDTGMSRGANSGRGGLLKVRVEEKHLSATAVYSDGKIVPVFPKAKCDEVNSPLPRLPFRGRRPGSFPERNADVFCRENCHGFQAL